MTSAKKQSKKRAVEEKPKSPAANERQTRLLIGLLCIGLSAIAVVPFFLMGRSATGSALELRMPITHDMFLHYDQMKSFYQGLSAGRIYPRWEEDTNRGFGAPTTSYYPPGVYYLTSAFYLATQDWLRTLLNTHLLMMVAAAASLYIYARRIMGRKAAIAAMAAYIFLPYHLVDHYHRGALAELLVFVWMPLMFLFGERLMNASLPTPTANPARRSSTLLNIAGLASSYGGFLWSHPPTAYQFTLAFGVYLLGLVMLRKEWKRLMPVGAALLLGVGLASVYLLPAASEQNLIHKEYVSEIWPYHNTYVFVHDLYNSDVHRGFFDLIDWIWITGAACIAIAAIALLGFGRRALNSYAPLKQRVLLWTVLGALASFMMTRLSMPIGKLIPKIDIGVFTWRMLAITTLIVALLAGALVEAASNVGGELRLRFERRLFASLAAFLIGVSVLISALAVVRPMIDIPVFEPEPEHLNWAMLPSNATDEAGDLPIDVPRAELAHGNGEASVEEWKPEHRVIRTSVTADDVLSVRTFNFPGWTAEVDGHPVQVKTSKELANIEIDLRAGARLVTLDFKETPVRRNCRILTLCSFGLLVMLWCSPLLRLSRSDKKDPS